jgi:hypothetical protein
VEAGCISTASLIALRVILMTVGRLIIDRKKLKMFDLFNINTSLLFSTTIIFPLFNLPTVAAMHLGSLVIDYIAIINNAGQALSEEVRESEVGSPHHLVQGLLLVPECGLLLLGLLPRVPLPISHHCLPRSTHRQCHPPPQDLISNGTVIVEEDHCRNQE